MRYFALILLFVAGPVAGLAGTNGKTSDHLVQYVDPFIGTGGHGHTYPGATVPGGMIQLSPDTRYGTWDGCAGYHYADSLILGFSHKHLSGTGCADLGDLLLMPMRATEADMQYYRQKFSHGDEHAEPGYYAVRLAESQIRVELTATARAGFHRYSIPAASSMDLVVDLVHGIEDSPTAGSLRVVNDSLIVGYRYSTGWAPAQRFHFALQFSKPFKSWRVTVDDSLARSPREAKGTRVRGVFEFPAGMSALLVKVGISGVSVDGALKNMLSEIPHWNFAKTRSEASAAWEKELRKFTVQSNENPAKRVFYTAVYHSLLAPVLFSDVNGSYRGGDSLVHASPGFDTYHIFSLWDTFRTLHPLYTITQPDRTRNIVRSILTFGKESGLLPVWEFEGNETNTMTGYHSVPVIVDAFLKGVKGFDPNEAFEAMKRSAHQMQRGVQFYSAQIPKDIDLRNAELRKEGVEPDPAWNNLSAIDTSQFVSGYESPQEGESLVYYRSLYPGLREALIARAQDGKRIRWQTAGIPSDAGHRGVTFVWPVAMASKRGAHRFALRVNGEHWFTFTTSLDGQQNYWKLRGPKGADLTFQAQLRDEYGDLFGHMYLHAPAGLLPSGSPASIEVQGDSAGSADWYMTFKHSLSPSVRAAQQYELVSELGRTRQLVKVEIEHLAPPESAEIRIGSGETRQLNLIPGLNVAYFSMDTVAQTSAVPVVAAVGKEKIAAACTVKPFSSFEYIPADREVESVSKTLDYAYDDWCIAQMAKALKKTDDYAYYMKRAGYYRHLYDETSGFMRGRNLDGSWVSPFNPLYGTQKQPQYTESNAWQAMWFVPHDIAGLVTLLGGEARALAKLDSLFEQTPNLADLGFPPDISGLIGMYAHGNEPSHHTVYLYSLLGRPWKTQELVKRILDSLYAPSQEGLCGNDDCGQMSAWYIMGSLGFAPVNPCGGEYVIGIPRFPAVSIDVGAGKRFNVVAKGLSSGNRYVQKVELNGKPLHGPILRHADVVKGGTLTFTMGNRPCLYWQGQQ
jgi:putative alpha-1,2-mannosidase